MKRYLFLSDVDGTLVNGDVLPDREVVRAAEEFRMAGGLLALCTGRGAAAAEPVARVIGVNAPCVLFGGALLYDFQMEEILWSCPFSTGILERMEQLLAEFPGQSLQALTARESFVLRRNAMLDVKGVKAENQGAERKLSEIRDPVLKLVLCGESREELAASKRCFPDGLCRFSFASRHFVDIVSGETGKERAMEELARRLDVPLARCLCAGDGMTDLPMLERAGMAYVPENAPEAVRAAAGLVIPRAEAGGMSMAFRHGAYWMSMEGTVIKHIF